MVNKILNVFKKKNYSSLPFVDMFGGSTKVNFEALGLAFSDWAYACISKRAEAVASMNWYAGKKLNDGTIEPVGEDNWLSQIIAEPNGYMSWNDLLSITVQWLDFNGNMFWYKLYNDNRSKLIGFVPLPPVNIRTELQSNVLAGYHINGKYYDKSEILHFKYLRPSIDSNDLMLGKSLIETAMNSISSNAEMNRFLKVYFENEGLPPLIGYIDPDLELTEEQLEQLKTQWRNRLPKNQISMIVDKRLQIVPLNTANVFSNSNITASIDSINKENIASIMGIPKGLITGDMQNRSTSETNYTTFMTNTINPLAKKLMQVINASIKNIENIQIICDLHNDKNKEYELNALQFGLLQGVITEDEYREFLGYGKKEETTVIPEITTLSLKKKV